MIKAIITDVDGVIVGKKQGVNFPFPNETVTKVLNKIHKKNIPIILCTTKSQSGILEIARKANLDNPHITDAGALVVDLLKRKVIKKHTLDKQLVQEITSICIDKGIYIECCGAENYFVQKNQAFELTERHSQVLQMKPKIVSSLEKNLAKSDIIKIIAFAKNEEDIKRVDTFAKKFVDKANIMWTIHPKTIPFQLCVFTVKGVSKKNASLDVLGLLNISPKNTLGIGDTFGDWNFMEICGYAATVGDESQELKDLVKTKGEGNYFFGSSVDKNGLIDIVNHFNL